MTRPEDANLPIWLRSEPLPPAPANLKPEAPAPAIPVAPQTEESAGLPSWLRDLSGTDQPDLSVEPEPSDEYTPEADDLPDWLRNLGETPAPAAQAVVPPEPALPIPSIPRVPGFTSWLTGEAPPEPSTPTAPSQEGLPAWLRESAATSEQEAPEQLPNWLQNLEPKPAASPTDQTMAAPPSWVEPSAATPIELPIVEEAVPDWLRTAQPSNEPDAEPSSTEVADEDIPAWLRSMPDSAIDAVKEETADLGLAPFSFGDAPASGSASEWLGANASQLINASSQSDELSGPAWLDAEQPSSEDSAQNQSNDPGDIPSWLRDAAGPIPADTPASATANTPVVPNEADDVPAWLRDVAVEPAATPAPAETPAWLADEASVPVTDTDTPAWLRDPAAAPESASVGSDSADLPAWMRDNDIQIPEPAASALPDWLQNTANLSSTPSAPSGDALPPWLRDEAGEPLPTSIAPGDAALPAWLRGTDSDLPVAPVAEPITEPTSLTASTATRQPNETAATSDSDLLGGADLPAWLRRDTEKPRDPNPADARSLDWLSRLGSVDDDIAQPIAPDSPRLMLPVAAARSAAQIEALSLLRTMAANPLPGAAPISPAAQANPFRQIGLDRVMSIVLLLALVAALIIPGLTNQLGIPQATPQANALFEHIRGLGPQDVVLIGYEWDAQRLSELRPLERAVVGQLIAQKVKVVLVSTDPQGALLQFDLRDQLLDAGYQGGGLDYVLLGYRPGGEIGLRQLAQDTRGALRSDFQGRDATIGVLATDPGTNQARISTLNDFSMLLVFADEPTDVQGWMEQIRPATTRPIGFLVPAAVAPFAQPYFRQPGIFYLAGTQDALAYEQQRGGDTAGQTALQAGQLRLATLIFAGLLAISTIGMLLYNATQRRRSAA